MAINKQKCKIGYCQRPMFVRGWCKGHYLKWWKYGNPLVNNNKLDNGSGTITKKGYRLITINGKRVYEHRYLLENKIGRKLSKEEHTHHKDHNKLNNLLENLEVIDIKEHGSIEGKTSRGIPKKHGKYCKERL